MIGVYLASSLLFCYQYFKYIPYFCPFVSVFWGTLLCSYCWVSLNALVMMLADVSGHLIIIAFGIPLIAYSVRNLREKRIEHLLLLTLEKIKSDTDALIQIQTIQDMIKQAKVTQKAEVTLVGYVNLHLAECKAKECPCKNDAELFDAATGKFSQRNSKRDGLNW